MLDTTTNPPGFYDVLAIEDPGFRRAEALSLAINSMLDDTDAHPIVRVAALVTVAVALLQELPQKRRTAMVDSLLADMREESLQPNA